MLYLQYGCARSDYTMLQKINNRKPGGKREIDGAVLSMVS